MPEGAYINLYLNSNGEDILLISNSGDCIETVLEAARGWREVAETEIEESGMTDYVAPEVPAAPNEEPQHQMYHYRVIVRNGVKAGAFVTEFRTRAQQALAQKGLACDVGLLEE